MEQIPNIPSFAADPGRGLTAEQAAERTAAGLAAGVARPVGKTAGQIVLSHVVTFFNLIFLVLAVMLAVGGSTVLNMGFLMVAAINTLIGIVQELRAKQAVDRLTLVAEGPVTVIREGKRHRLPPRDIVRDDIAEFAQGDQPPADGILCTGELWVDESLVTGEADPVEKKPGQQILSGSVVLAGRGRVRLTAVGEAAFAAGLSREAKKDPKAKKSEMMAALDRLILAVALVLVPLGLALFRQEYHVLGLSLRESVEGTVAALVGMIPEGLYLLTSMALAASALKLSRDRVLVRDMNCIETLARVDVLCVDKTGTITKPDMEVEAVLPLSGHSPVYVETVLTALYGSREPDNATARAIHSRFPGESDWVCRNYIPFSPECKWSGGDFGNRGAFLVGAPEWLLGNRYGQYREQVERRTNLGCRVLLVGRYRGELRPGIPEPDRVEPLALVVLTGSLRENARETFRYFTEQGVSVRVISGDDPRTASRTALRAGIPGAESWVDTTLLDTDRDFAEAVEKNTVFGRVTPEKKKRLIAALQAGGHTVAMTGDGVNDLPAMKQADCSLAMFSGAQAASQLADLVLLDSDFAAIPGIVAEGRRVINNIQRAAGLFLVKNIFSIVLTVLSLLTGWHYPLVPVHLTVISAMTIGIPSFFLAMEPNYERVKGCFLRGVFRRAFPGGLTNVAGVLLCQLAAARLGLAPGTVTTACAAVLATVGLLVLYQTCKPFGRFRRLIWWTMAVGLMVCFTFLGPIFGLRASTVESKLLMFLLLLVTPPLFFIMQRLVNWGEEICVRLRR